MGRREMHCFVALSALVTIAWAEPVNAQQEKAGVPTCDVSEGMGYVYRLSEAAIMLVRA
jgi:hypothetical protein